MSAKTAVEVLNLRMLFRDKERPILALDNFNLRVFQGEFLAIVGPSGCGKTTVLQMIGGIADKGEAKGRIRINGSDPEEAKKRREMGVVFQDLVIYPHKTVKENVTVYLKIMRKDKRARNETAKKLLSMVGIREDRWDSQATKLSGGQQQRIAIARALSYQPKLLLLDEPFGALDAFTREKLNFELLRIWREAGKQTIFFVTHSIEEAVLLSDRVVVMSSQPGRVLDTMSITLARPRSLETKEKKKFFDYVRRIRRVMKEGNNEK